MGHGRGADLARDGGLFEVPQLDVRPHISACRSTLFSRQALTASCRCGRPAGGARGCGMKGLPNNRERHS